MSKLLLPMIDGGIVSINYESYGFGGCETCDYGSSYVNEYQIKLTSGTLIVKVDQEYAYALSEGYMMELLLSNVDDVKRMTEEKFVEWVESEVTTHVDKGYYSGTVTTDFFRN